MTAITGLVFLVTGVSAWGGSEEQLRKTWFAGAEVSTYTLNQARYGAEHPGVATLIFVTEPFDTEKQVKSDRRDANDVDVLKLNALREFNTGIYPYRTMSSLFMPLFEDDPRALKMTLSVQDWCGQAWGKFNRVEGETEIEMRSYFESEGDADTTVTGEHVWWEDELWTLLRRDPALLPTGDVSMIPGGLGLRFSHREWRAYDAVARLSPGRSTSTYRVEIPELGRFLEIKFKTAFPYEIQGWKERDSARGPVTEAKLLERMRNSSYWSENKPSDRKLRKRLGLSETP